MIEPNHTIKWETGSANQNNLIRINKFLINLNILSFVELYSNRIELFMADHRATHFIFRREHLGSSYDKLVSYLICHCEECFYNAENSEDEVSEDDKEELDGE